MVRCNIVPYVRSTILALSSIVLPLLKSYILQLYLFASATRGEGLSGAVAARLYLTKEYLAVASETEMWIKNVTYGVLYRIMHFNSVRSARYDSSIYISITTINKDPSQILTSTPTFLTLFIFNTTFCLIFLN